MLLERHGWDRSHIDIQGATYPSGSTAEGEKSRIAVMRTTQGDWKKDRDSNCVPAGAMVPSLNSTGIKLNLTQRVVDKQTHISSLQVHRTAVVGIAEEASASGRSFPRNNVRASDALTWNGSLRITA